jgi:hypothetical protein
LLQKGTAKIHRLRTNWEYKAELWEYTEMLQVVSIDGEGITARARVSVTCGNSREREEDDG